MKIDYSSYTLEEIKEARSFIDEEAYPDRVKELDALLKEFGESDASKATSNAQQEINKYSTFAPRFLASIVDGIVLSILSATLIYIGSSSGGVIQTLFEYVDYMQYAIYSVLLHGLYGQTLGKMAANVKVVDVETEGAISFPQALLRDCVPILSLIIMLLVIIFASSDMSNSTTPEWALYAVFVFGITMMIWHMLEIVTMLFNEKRRALHDFIAGTVVVRVL